jgi:uncharacterized tellurite resistance protein B-like protein
MAREEPPEPDGRDPRGRIFFYRSLFATVLVLLFATAFLVYLWAMEQIAKQAAVASLVALCHPAPMPLLASLLRFLGLSSAAPARVEGDTAAVRRISEKLERLEPGFARYVAAFAYVLARVASADLRVEDEEVDEMARVVEGMAQLPADVARLVVEIARSQARLLGPTENYSVTREFKRISTPVQRADLLRCLFRIAGADDTISAEESAEIFVIGEELGFAREQVNAVRLEFRAKLSELRPRRS